MRRTTSKRLNEYYEVMENMLAEGHVVGLRDHTCLAKCRCNGIIDRYILDNYGNRYMATHMPDFCVAPNIIAPFHNNLTQMKCAKQI